MSQSSGCWGSAPGRSRPPNGLNHGPDLHNLGIYYQVRVVAGSLRPEPNGDTTQPSWTALDTVPQLARSSLVDIGLALARERPRTGHVPAVRVGGLIQH